MAEKDAERGRELAERARAWIVANPEGWDGLVKVCRYLAAEGYPVRRDNVFCDLSRTRLRITDTPAYVKAHDLWSGLARYVARYCPDVKPNLSPCTIDKAYPTLGDLPALPSELVPGGGRYGH